MDRSEWVLGDTVEWTSQAQGYARTKRGQIIGIVEPGVRPSRRDFPALYKGAGPGMPRNHASYVVKVGSKLYWPRVSGLAAPPPPAEQASGEDMHDDLPLSDLLAEAERIAANQYKDGRYAAARVLRILCHRISQPPVQASGELLYDLELVWHSVSDDRETNAAYERLKAALSQRPVVQASGEYGRSAPTASEEAEAKLDEKVSQGPMHPDTIRLNWMEHMVRNNGGLVLHLNDYDRARRTAVGLGLMPGTVDRDLRSAIDQSLPTDWSAPVYLAPQQQGGDS